MPGRLVVAATPIGNPADASARLRDLLATADIVAAEDTRRLKRLLQGLQLTATGRVVSYHDHNEGPRTDDLIADLQAGNVVVLVTDAGMPSISDPGFRLVAAAVAAGVPVTVAPGPSALTAALTLSGLPIDRFCFEGFLPRRAGQRRQRLHDLADEPRTMVFFEAPHRLADVLTDMVDVWGGDRRGAVCRELTKTHEEVVRGSLAELVQWASAGVRGEITLVMAGASGEPVNIDADGLRQLVNAAIAAGSTRRDAIDEVARHTGQPRRRVYDAAHS